MVVRALMVDVDGVVVRHQAGRRWDETLLEDRGLAPDLLNAEFFRPFFSDIALGRDDLRRRLDDVLPRIAAHLDADALMRYWFEHDSSLDEGLVRDLGDLRSGGMEVHLATTQEHHRAAHLWWRIGLAEHFDAMHYSADLGHAKPSREFFRVVEKRSGFAPHELLLLDDRAENIEGAHAAGWAAHLWTPTSSVSDLGLPPSSAPVR